MSQAPLFIVNSCHNTKQKQCQHHANNLKYPATAQYHYIYIFMRLKTYTKKTNLITKNY